MIVELWLKPVIWLVPLLLWNFFLKKRIVIISSVGWLKSVAFGLLVGVFYFFVVGRLNFRWASLDLSYLGIALSISVTEEIVFSGFIFEYLSSLVKNRALSTVFVSLMAAGSHLPIMLFGYSLNFFDLLPSLFFVFGYSLLNVSVRAVTGNVLGSIVARVLLVLVVS